MTSKKATSTQDDEEPDEVSDSDEIHDFPGQITYVDEDPEYESEIDSDNEDKQKDDTEEEEVFAGVVTMNENFVTRSGRKVGAPKKFMYD